MTTAPTGPSGPAGPGPGRDLTGPTQPAPRPLPNPGPPPAPGGHLPIGAPGGRLPLLAELVRDLRESAVGMIVVAGRQYDPTSAGAEDYDPLGVTYADRILGCVVSDLRTVLRDLDKLAQTVQYPARQALSCLSGGSASHPVLPPGEGLSPGLAAGTRDTGARSDRPVVGPLAGASHLAAAAASGGLLPGLAVPPGESEATRLGRGAGDSSDPGRRLSQRAPDGNGVTPGVGFTLPVTERFTMPGTERIARSINEALARRAR